MHLTLAFLGEVPEPTLEAARAAVAAAADQIGPFRALLGRAGAFPNERRPRVVWVGLDAGAEEVGAAALRVRAALAERRVPFDDADALAHITIGRVRERAGPEERLAVADAFRSLREAVPALAFEIAALHLVQSVLSKRGPTYASIAEARLGRV